MAVKDGTGPAALRLPKGGGAVTAISEGFKPDLASGTGNYTVPIEVPEGRVPLPVPLELAYSTGFGNGPFGLGWDLSGPPVIRRRLDDGIPRYGDADRLELTGAGELARLGGNRYRALIEEGFRRIERAGDAFTVRDREGRVLRLGETAASRLADPADPSRVLAWLASSIEDPNGNRTELRYRRDDERRAHLGAPAGQLYLSQVLHNNLPGGGFLYRVELDYEFDGPGERRPDPILGYRAGFALETNWRCRSIEVRLGDDGVETCSFRALPDGAPVTSARAVQPNAFEGCGLLVSPVAPLGWADLALVPAGAMPGADTAFLGLRASGSHVTGEVELILFRAPARRVTLRFYGAGAGYALRAYDELDRPIEEAPEEGPPGGLRAISIEAGRPAITRLVFGSPSAVFGLVEVEVVYDVAPLCRRYELGYDDTGPGRLSLLRSVQVLAENPDGTRASRPAIGFAYSVADEADPAVRAVAGAPSVSLASERYEVVDLVGSGTPDVLYTAGPNDHRYYLNRGAHQLAGPSGMATAPSATLADAHARLGDITGAVAADLYTNQHVYPSPSLKAGRLPGDPLEWGAQGPLTGFPAFAPEQLAEVRLFDLTGDGRLDLLRTADRFSMWFQQPDQTWVAQPPVDRVASYLEADWPDVTFADARIKLADMNGDGLLDIVRVDPDAARVEYWPHKGLGRWGSKRTMRFDGGGLAFPLGVQRMLFADVDGNGFADLVYVGNGELAVWPNLGGDGFGPPRRITGTPLVGSGALDAVRMVDLTGAGTLGVLWTRDGAAGEETFRFLDLTGGVKPHLLVEIRNGTGGVTEVEYSTSSVLYHADERAGRPWRAAVPFPVHVVTKVTKRDSITGVAQETRYAYRDGCFDRERRRFLGFRTVTVTHAGRAAPPGAVRGGVEVHRFHQRPFEGLTAAGKARARALAGREILVEHLDEDGSTLLQWTRTDWTVVPAYRWQEGSPAAAEADRDGTPVLFPYARGDLQGFEEGTSELRMRYAQEVRSLAVSEGGAALEIAASHGQVLERRLYGEVALRGATDAGAPRLTTVRRGSADVDVVDRPEDTRLVTRRFAVNEATNLIQVAAEVTRDAAGTIVAERHAFFDGAEYEGLPAGAIDRGNLSRQLDLVASEATLAALYGASPYAPDWAALGYRRRALSDGSGDGLYVLSHRLRTGELGLPTGVLSPLGQPTSLVYDRYRTRLERVTNALGHGVSASYDYRTGLQTRYTDENGNVWRRVYDGFGRLLEEIEPGDTGSRPTRRYEYLDDEAARYGSPVAVVQYEQGGDGPLTTYHYFDGFLRDLQTRRLWRRNPRASSLSAASSGRTGPRGSSPSDRAAAARDRLLQELDQYQVTSRTHNARGMPAEETLPYLDLGPGYRAAGTARPARRYGFDALLRLARTTNPDATQRVVQYGPWRSTVSDEEDTEPASAHYDTPTSFGFDAQGSVARADLRLGSRTLTYRFHYDAYGNLARVVDPALNEVRWSFDTRGLLLRVAHPDAGTVLCVYDAMGKEAARLHPNGDLVESFYDALGRLTRRRIGGPSPRTETLVYDAGEGTHLVGRLAEATDAVGVVAYGYDARGREVRQKRTFSSQPGVSYTTALAYDSMGRLERVTYPNGAVVDYVFGAHGKVERIPGLVSQVDYHAGGQPSRLRSAAGAEHVIVYDPLTHRVSRRIVTAGGATALDLAYAYDGVGNLVAVTDAVGSPAGSFDRRYDYDDLYRVVAFDSGQGHSESYGYDDAGNVVAHTGYSPAPLVYPAAGPSSRLLGAQGEAAWAYDANGRLTKGAGFDTLEWDAAQRLTRVVEASGVTRELRCSYEGDLLERTVTSAAAAAATTRVVNEHFAVYPGYEACRVYLEEALAVVLSGSGAGRVASFVVADQARNVIGVADDAGSYTRIEYAPHGKVIYPAAVAFPHRFAGAEEPATDLLLLGSRFLLARVGRWVQPDPLLLRSSDGLASRPQSLNAYAYASNNPMNRIDVLGLVDVAIAGVWGEPESFQNRAILSRARQTARHAGYRVRRAESGRALIRHLANLSSRDDPIRHLVIFGHGSEGRLLINQPFQIDRPTRAERRTGTASVADLRRAIQDGRVVFSPDAEIHLFTCRAAYGINAEDGWLIDGNPAVNLAREIARIVPGRWVYAPSSSMRSVNNAAGTAETGTFTTEGVHCDAGACDVPGDFVRVRYADGLYEVERIGHEHDAPGAPWTAP